MQTSPSDGKLTSETYLPNFLVEEKSIKCFILLCTDPNYVTGRVLAWVYAQKKSVTPVIRFALFSFHN